MSVVVGYLRCNITHNLLLITVVSEQDIHFKN